MQRSIGNWIAGLTASRTGGIIVQHFVASRALAELTKHNNVDNMLHEQQLSSSATNPHSPIYTLTR